MKKILSIFALLILGLMGFSQVPIGCPTCTTDVKGTLKVDSLFLLPLRTDTNINPGRAGAIVSAYNNTWLFTGTQWALLTGVAWGAIPGDITHQADLMGLLNAKQNQISNGYGWKLTGAVGMVDSAVFRKVDTVVKLNDSTLQFSINGRPYPLLIRGSASGTVVTAISLNVPTALFNTPVTLVNTSGAWAGNLTLVPQGANTFLSGPVTGTSAQPTFRQMNTADLPTGIPVNNLAANFIGFAIDATGAAPAWSGPSIVLGNTVTLHMPVIAPGVSAGTVNSSLFAYWNAKVDSTTRGNDSIYEWRNGIAYYRYRLIAGGSDSGIDVRFQSLTGGVPLAKFVDGSGHRFVLYDTIGSHPGGLPTNAGVRKVLDSTQNLLATSIATKQPQLSGTGYVKFSATTPSYLTPTQVTADLNVFTPTLNGLAPLSGGGTTNFLRADMTWAAPPGTTFANPSASIGLTAVNGTATTAMRSDAAPALSQSISPTWSGTHTFNNAPIFGSLSGFVKANSSTALTAVASIGNSDLASMPANTFKVNNTGSVTVPIDATAAQATAMLGTFTSSLKGLVPPPGGSPTGANVLSDIGTWIANGSGGGGSQTLTLDARQDTLGISGQNAVPLDPNPHNIGLFNGDKGLRNSVAKMGNVIDTGNFTSGADSAQFVMMINGNSMFEHIDTWEPHFVKYMDAKFHCAGPGFVSGSGIKFGLALVAPVAEWTALSAFSTPTGRGPDTYELASTGATSDSIIVAVGTQNQSLDYCQWTVTEVWYYAAAGNGTFRVVIDGVNYGNVNTATGSGPQRFIVRNLPYRSHTVSVAPVTEGTNHIHILGFNCYQSGTRGFIMDKVAKGASNITDWTKMDSTNWTMMIGWLHPTLTACDWVVTSITIPGGLDSAAYVKRLDTMTTRLRAVDSNMDIVVFGPTPYNLGGMYSTPINPLDAYSRTIKRYAYDKGFGYWDPFSIYSTNVVKAMQRNLIITDSLHRSPQGSQAEVGAFLNAIGVIGMSLPTIPANFYQTDGDILSSRTVNFHNQTLHFDSLSSLRLRGITGNPVMAFDFTNSLQVSWTTGGIRIVGDMPINTSQPFTSTYTGLAVGNYNATLANTGTGEAAFLVGGGGTNCTTCYLNYGTVSATAFVNNLENTNAGAGYANYQAKTDGTGNPGFTAVNNSVTATFGQDHGAGNAIKIGFGGLTFPNTAITIPTNLHTLLNTGTDRGRFLQLNGGIWMNKDSAITSTAGTVLSLGIDTATGMFVKGTFGGGGGGSLTGSGTTNMVAKWTGTTALGTGAIEDSAGYVGVGVNPDATGTWGFLQGAKNTRLNFWNGAFSAGYLSTNQTSSNMRVEFHRTASSGTNGFYFEGGSSIFENTATGEIQHYAPTAGFFPTWYANNAEFMRGSAAGHLSIGLTADSSAFLNLAPATTSVAQIYFKPSAVDPTAPKNGHLWFDSLTNTFNFRHNGVTSNLLAGGGSTPTIDQVLSAGSQTANATWTFGGFWTKLSGLRSDTNTIAHVLVKGADSAMREITPVQLATILPQDTTSYLMSIVGTTNNPLHDTVTLVNDQTSPGANMAYGTNASGTKGWQPGAAWGAYLPTVTGGGTVTTVNADSCHWTRSGPIVTVRISGTITFNATGTNASITWNPPFTATTVNQSRIGSFTLSGFNTVLGTCATVDLISNVLTVLIDPNFSGSSQNYSMQIVYHLY